MIGDFEPRDPPRQTILMIDWHEVEMLVNVIAHDIKAYKPHTIVAIARGGLIPATMISHKLNVPLEVIHASAYEGTRRTLKKPIVIDGWKEQFNQFGTVFIDDIMDTGDTWDAVLYGAGRLATNMKGQLFTLCKKDKARYTSWINYGLRVQGDVWVKFPWEIDE